MENIYASDVFIGRGSADLEQWHILQERASAIGCVLLSGENIARALNESESISTQQSIEETERQPEGPVVNLSDFMSLAPSHFTNASTVAHAQSLATKSYTLLMQLAEKRAFDQAAWSDMPPLVMGVPLQKVPMKNVYTDGTTTERQIEAQSLLHLAEELLGQADKKHGYDKAFGHLKGLGPKTVAFWRAVAIKALESDHQPS